MSRCQFCKHLIDPRGVIVDYGASRYHLACWDKLRLLAARSGGTL